MDNQKTEWKVLISSSKNRKFFYEEDLNIYDYFETLEEWLLLSEEERDAWLFNKALEITLNEYVDIGVY